MIRTERRDGDILHLRLDDPPRRNALDTRAYVELAAALESASASQTRAVLISASGSVFCAGNDLPEFDTHWPQPPHGPVYRFLAALHGCPCPVVAAVQGGAVGIGATLLLHCDVIVMSQAAWLCYPFAGLGFTVEGGASRLLPARIGWPRSMQLLLSARRLPADEALRLGLATRCVEGDPMPVALEEALHIASLRPELVRALKRQLRDADPGDFPARFEDEIQLIGRLLLAQRSAGGRGPSGTLEAEDGHA